MSTSVYRPHHLSEVDLKALVLDALAKAPGPNELETYHARYDHLERGISLDDVIHAVERSWVYERVPEWNASEWQWKYRILSETIDGDELTIIIAVDTANRIFEVVTKWKPRQYAVTS
jgi:hypothetical protein